MPITADLKCMLPTRRLTKALQNGNNATRFLTSPACSVLCCVRRSPPARACHHRSRRVRSPRSAQEARTKPGSRWRPAVLGSMLSRQPVSHHVRSPCGCVARLREELGLTTRGENDVRVEPKQSAFAEYMLFSANSPGVARNLAGFFFNENSGDTHRSLSHSWDMWR